MMTESEKLSEVQRLLQKIVTDGDLEIEWIDLLSQLEYVGCRKIVKSVSYEKIDAEILRHIAEEARHSWLLKTIVEQKKRMRSWKEGFFSDLGWQYFQDLDKEISIACKEKEWSYPAVSFAIEKRVLLVYPCYLEMTKLSALKAVLGHILAEERVHERRFEMFPLPETLREKSLEIEEKLWTRFSVGAIHLSGLCQE